MCVWLSVILMLTGLFVPWAFRTLGLFLPLVDFIPWMFRTLNFSCHLWTIHNAVGLFLSLFTGRQHSLLCKHCTSHRWNVCLSVPPSVTRWHWVKMTQARITKSSPTDNTTTLVFGIKNSSRNSKGFTPSEGVKCEWGWKNSLFSANKSP